MGYRIIVDEQWTIHCDTAHEALELSNLLAYVAQAGDDGGDRDTASLEDYEEHFKEMRTEAEASRPLTKSGGKDKRRGPHPRRPSLPGSNKERVIEWIKKHGPARQSTILKQLGIPIGSAGTIFNDKRFYSDEDQLVNVSDDDVVREHLSAIRSEVDRQRDEQLSALAKLESKVEEPPSKPEPKSPNTFDGTVAVKPKLIEALSSAKADGLSVEQLVAATGLHKDRVRSGLVNHRDRTFVRLESGNWVLKGMATTAPQPVPEKKPPAIIVKPKTKGPSFTVPDDIWDDDDDGEEVVDEEDEDDEDSEALQVSAPARRQAFGNSDLDTVDYDEDGYKILK